MNHLEREMVELLKQGRDECGWVAAKAEFEAEGTRLDELNRLVEVVRRAGLRLALKIGGCEALTDLYIARLTGADYVIAPMIESGFALEKYRKSISKAFSVNELDDVSFLWNIETIKGAASLVEFEPQLGTTPRLAGAVFGRSDFAGSLGLDPDSTDSDVVTSEVLTVSQWCSERDLELVVGGGVSVRSVPVLRQVREVNLARFETRKVIFDAACLDLPDSALEQGLLNALRFELAWLENKARYYDGIVEQDRQRISALRARWAL